MSSDVTSEKVLVLFIATPNNTSSKNFQRLILVIVSMKCISRNFDIGALKLGQFCDLSIISQLKKIESHLLDENHSKHSLIGLHADLTP